MPSTAHQAGHWVSFDGNATHDRVCQNLTECDYDNEYESTLAGRYNNRYCTPLRVCDGNVEHETTAKTQTSDRNCTTHSTCDIPILPHREGEYITFAGDANNNRRCADLTAHLLPVARPV